MIDVFVERSLQGEIVTVDGVLLFNCIVINAVFLNFPEKTDGCSYCVPFF